MRNKKKRIKDLIKQFNKSKIDKGILEKDLQRSQEKSSFSKEYHWKMIEEQMKDLKFHEDKWI